MSLQEHDAQVRVDRRKQTVTIRTQLASITFTLAGFLALAQFVQEVAAGSSAR